MYVYVGTCTLHVPYYVPGTCHSGPCRTLSLLSTSTFLVFHLGRSHMCMYTCIYLIYSTCIHQVHSIPTCIIVLASTVLRPPPPPNYMYLLPTHLMSEESIFFSFTLDAEVSRWWVGGATPILWLAAAGPALTSPASHPSSPAVWVRFSLRLHPPTPLRHHFFLRDLVFTGAP